MLVEDCDSGCAQELAQTLFAALSEPFVAGGAPVHVGACVGVATADPSGTSASDLLRDADTALHAAKATGRGRARVFDRALAEDVEHRSALAADLRAALAEDALSLHYQPVVRPRDRPTWSAWRRSPAGCTPSAARCRRRPSSPSPS